MQGMELAATARPEAQASEGTAKPPKTAKAKGKTVKAVSVPYKGPNGDTWSGRGLQPRWVRVHIERGGKLDDLKVAA
jgi:DNA-binding protein H-NS